MSSIGPLRLPLVLPRVQRVEAERVVAGVCAGIGHLKVIVPANASVDLEGRVQAGEMELLGEKDDGTHVHAHVVDRTGSGRVLVLDARTGLGQVEVQRG